MDNEDDVIRPISRQLPKERNMESGDLVTYPANDRGGYTYGVVVSVLPGSIILDTYTADPVRIEVDRMGVVLQYKKCEWKDNGDVPHREYHEPAGQPPMEIQTPSTRRQPTSEVIRL